MVCKKDSKRLKIMAHQKLVTWKPSIKLAAKRIIMAFITKRNSPRVRIVIGNVKITNMGFTRKLRRLSTTATMMAVIMESTPTPGNT